MRFKSLCKAAAAVTLAAAMITASGCNNEKNDNTAEITVGPGDTLAEMTIQIGEETGKIRFKLFPRLRLKASITLSSWLRADIMTARQSTE
ncbi:MAG: hypothetical protein V8T26_07170 [[Eubacterium] siraeum]